MGAVNSAYVQQELNNRMNYTSTTNVLVNNTTNVTTGSNSQQVVSITVTDGAKFEAESLNILQTNSATLRCNFSSSSEFSQEHLEDLRTAVTSALSGSIAQANSGGFLDILNGLKVNNTFAMQTINTEISNAVNNYITLTNVNNTIQMLTVNQESKIVVTNGGVIRFSGAVTIQQLSTSMMAASSLINNVLDSVLEVSSIQDVITQANVAAEQKAEGSALVAGIVAAVIGVAAIGGIVAVVGANKKAPPAGGGGGGYAYAPAPQPVYAQPPPRQLQQQPVYAPPPPPRQAPQFQAPQPFYQ